MTINFKKNLRNNILGILGIIVAIIGIIIEIILSYGGTNLKIGDLKINGNNNVTTINVYPQEKTNRINQEIKKTQPEKPLADIIVKINAPFEPEGIALEYKYIKSLKCGDREQGSWERTMQGLISQQDGSGMYFDALTIKCSKTGEEKVIYFDISDWFGRWRNPEMNNPY